jgi:hypothetical protein
VIRNHGFSGAMALNTSHNRIPGTGDLPCIIAVVHSAAFPLVAGVDLPLPGQADILMIRCWCEDTTRRGCIEPAAIIYPEKHLEKYLEGRWMDVEKRPGHREYQPFLSGTVTL